MATFCSQCGEELPRDDARFCNNCGAMRLTRLPQVPSLTRPANNSVSGPTTPENAGPVGESTIEQVSPPVSSEQVDFPILPSTPPPYPSRELHVKVWDEEKSFAQEGYEPRQGAGEHEAARAGLSEGKPLERERDAVEDLPTRMLESVAPLPQSSQAGFPADDAPTSPILVIPDEQPQSRLKQSTYAGPSPQQRLEQGAGNVPDVAHINTVHLQAQHSPVSLSPVASSPGNYPVTPPQPASSTNRARKRLPLIIGISAVVLLLVLALGSWILLLQPFRVSSTTDVQKSFTDTRLGVSLRYPNGWKAPQVNYGKQIVTFQDASDTAQINLSVANAPAGSISSYLQKQATQYGISNAKAGSPSSFGGSSWQSVEGETQVKGAQYTCGLFVTTHKNHLYTIAQLAPQSTYADEEKLIFAPTRLSLHFL